MYHCTGQDEIIVVPRSFRIDIIINLLTVKRAQCVFWERILGAESTRFKRWSTSLLVKVYELCDVDLCHTIEVNNLLFASYQTSVSIFLRVKALTVSMGSVLDLDFIPQRGFLLAIGHLFR